MTTNPDLVEAVGRLTKVREAMPSHPLHFALRSIYGREAPNAKFNADLRTLLAAVTPPLRGGEELGLSVAESAALPQEARPANASDDLLDALINVLNDLAPIDYDDEVLEPGSDARVAAYWLRPSVVRAREAIANAEGR
jgi:hypothetical protein